MPDFLMTMPQDAVTYAIPVEYTEQGFVKKGRNGAVHQRAWERLTAVKGLSPAKVITVFLDDATDLVALKDGRPVMSSHGFSEYDGIMSRTGCGAVDTAIVFQLFAAGYSAGRIEQILASDSGFEALTNKATGLLDLVTGGGEQMNLARDIFAYQLVKAIGSCAAILGGIDALVFIGPDRQEIRDWAECFLGELACLGFVRCQQRPEESSSLLACGPAVDAYYFVVDISA